MYHPAFLTLSQRPVSSFFRLFVWYCAHFFVSLHRDNNILNLCNMETTIKKTREEVRAAFREMMCKKRERVQKSRENLELMYQQGLFNY